MVIQVALPLGLFVGKADAAGGIAGSAQGVRAVYVQCAH